MALKKCKECGAEVSSSGVCPKCGKDQRNFFVKHKVITFILIVICLGIIIGATGGSSNNTTTTTSSDTTSTSTETEEKVEYQVITIDKLEDALEDNAASAKEKYNGKYLEITGRLGTIDSDLKYISLLSTTDSYDLVGVHCTIKSDEQRTAIKKLKTGDTIIVKGKITDVGEVLGYYLDIDEVSKK